MRDIEIKGLCKAFDGKQVLRDFSAVLPAGQVTGLMAPSGAGKTTLLRILMGLETQDRGDHHGPGWSAPERCVSGGPVV